MTRPLRTQMSVKTRLAAPVLHAAGGSTALAQRLRVGRILMFHGIDDRHHPAASFEAQLAYLSKHFTIVPLAVMLQHLGDPKAGASFAGKIALTFDDGLRNNYTLAYPLLRRYHAPATFFVCPGLIDERRWQWSHEAAARLESLDETRRAALAAAVGAPAASADGVKEWMKTLPLARREAIEHAIRTDTPRFSPTEAQLQEFDPMTWDEVRSLDPALITIGSHTISHPILSRLSPAEAAAEIRTSRERLEARLDRRVDYFCYPDGAHDDAIVDLVRGSYRAAVTTVPGFVGGGDDLHRLRRIPAAEPLFLLAWRLHRPTA